MYVCMYVFMYVYVCICMYMYAHMFILYIYPPAMETGPLIDDKRDAFLAEATDPTLVPPWRSP